MRTSGSDSDLALFLMPVTVLAVLVVVWFGGPREVVSAIDRSVLQGLAWAGRLWR